MRLLFVIDTLDAGGAQRQIVNLALGMQRRGHQVELFAFAPGDLLARPLCQAGIPVVWRLKRSRFSFAVILALREQIRRSGCDLVLAYLPTPNFYAIVAGQLSGRRGVPVVVSERRCDLPQGAQPMERFARQSYRLADRIVANSQQQRDELAARYPWMRARLCTIRNGLDLDLFVPPVAEPDNRPLRAVTISGIAPHKNGLCLIEALRILSERDHLRPCLDWIGKLPAAGKPSAYLARMNQALQDYGLTRQWQWLGQRADIVRQLHEHEVLVHPSYIEGLPNAVCEAMACARPVIASAIPENARLIQPGISGYLFDPADPADLADALKRVAQLSVAERRQMGRNGRRFAEDHLSLHRLVTAYETLFETLLTARG
jgi:glycosyltransferase involved in cell wall biosynthesis